MPATRLLMPGLTEEDEDESDKDMIEILGMKGLIGGKNTKCAPSDANVAKTQTCIFKHSSAKIYVMGAETTGRCTRYIAHTH